jgi:hypothetical protein
MKNHNQETGAPHIELPWNEISNGLLPAIKEGTKSELVRIVTDKGQEGFARFNYSNGWEIEAVVDSVLKDPHRYPSAICFLVKAWKYIELYSERWQPKPSKPIKKIGPNEVEKINRLIDEDED